ncbi:MAG: hypothetical protein J2O48_00755 [Solirubrobacterales bacterium]|nr:hypothetical protein [Solirubrobacterales bacterium]
MTDQQQPDPQQGASEEELRAAYEAEIKKINVQQVLLENVVTLINLGMRRAGLIEGTEDERDPTQVQTAIEGVRTLAPLIDATAPEQASQVRDALSQLQMAYVQIGGGGELKLEGAEAPAPAQPGKEGAGPAQSSGKLWVPGQ